MTTSTDRLSTIKSRAKAVKDAKPEPKAADAKPEPTRDPNDLSVADVARELGLNPKVVRAKLRRHNIRAKDGRHARVMRGSPDHVNLLAILAPTKADTTPAS